MADMFGVVTSVLMHPNENVNRKKRTRTPKERYKGFFRFISPIYYIIKFK